MNSFELNKIAGTVLGTLLLAMGLGFLGEGIFHMEVPEKPGYAIEVAEGGEAAGEAAPAGDPPIAELLASADPAKGESVAKKCAACHGFDKGGPNKTGPDLYGVVGRTPGTHAGFAYSAEMVDFGKDHVWDYENLYHFLKDPKGIVSGTKMGFAGLKKPGDRADLIAYLRTLADTPEPLPGN